MSKESPETAQMSVRPKEIRPGKAKRKKRHKSKLLTLDVEAASHMAAGYGPNTAKAASTVKRLGFQDLEVSEAIKKLRESETTITFDSLIDMAYVIQKKFLEREVSNHNGQKMEQAGIDHSEACEKEHFEGDTDADLEDEDGDEDEEVTSRVTPEGINLKLKKAIEKRKQALRESIDAMTFTCQVCRSSKATILMLPCGHLASCDDCLMDIRRCPVARCNKIVRGTKEVFFV